MSSTLTKCQNLPFSHYLETILNYPPSNWHLPTSRSIWLDYHSLYWTYLYIVAQPSNNLHPTSQRYFRSVVDKICRETCDYVNNHFKHHYQCSFGGFTCEDGFCVYQGRLSTLWPHLKWNSAFDHEDSRDSCIRLECSEIVYHHRFPMQTCHSSSIQSETPAIALPNAWQALETFALFSEYLCPYCTNFIYVIIEQK